jgi:hypothetical protein
MLAPLPRHLLTLGLLIGLSATAAAEEAKTREVDPLKGQAPVLMSLAKRDAPSDEEWEDLHDGKERANLFGSLGDLKAETVSFMDTRYYTGNSAEGTLASYGKAAGKNSFDRYGHILGVTFDVPSNAWKERYVLNAAALVKLTGKARFAEFAGVELNTAARSRRQIEVTFVGTTVPKDEAIRRLNSDVGALEYLGTLYTRFAQHKQKGGLFNGSPPPQPKVVLSNVVMLDAKSSKVLEGSVGADVKTVIHGIGGQLQVARQSGEEIALLTPVVRCYRTYTIEFKTDANGNLAKVVRTDRSGRRFQLPVVFDLTPDL